MQPNLPYFDTPGPQWEPQSLRPWFKSEVA